MNSCKADKPAANANTGMKTWYNTGEDQEKSKG
jgi:hypothetical protein